MEIFTRKSLQNDLCRAGLKPDDTVLIHSSMKHIGAVENRADGVLDALMDYFAPGLLVFPTLSYSLVNVEHPEFSVLETPSVVGILPELFRKRPGVVRSLHPTHSVAAFGRDAEYFVSGHENFDSPCAKASPWGRLYDRHAKILFIGTSLRCNTFLHGVEEWLPVPEMLSPEPQKLVVIDAAGRHIPVPSRRHIGGHNHYYGDMEPLFRAGNALTDWSFGAAKSYCLDCRRAGDLIFAELKKNPHLFCPVND